MAETQSIKVGDIIMYILSASDNPMKPEKEYTGKVIGICPTSNIRVELLGEGYEGMEETIKPEQIKKIVNENENKDKTM